MKCPAPLDLLRKVLAYVWTVDSRLDAPKIASTMQVNPILGDQVMTIAEQLIEKGRSEGLEKGHSEGEAKGIGKGKPPIAPGIDEYSEGRR